MKLRTMVNKYIHLKPHDIFAHGSHSVADCIERQDGKEKDYGKCNSV